MALPLGHSQVLLQQASPSDASFRQRPGLPQAHSLQPVLLTLPATPLPLPLLSQLSWWLEATSLASLGKGPCLAPLCVLRAWLEGLCK